MTQEEIIKRSYEVYPEPLNDNYPSTKEYLEAKARAEDKRISYIKGLTEQLDCPTIKGWVARESDGYIYLFAEKPTRNQKIGGWNGTTLLEFPKGILPQIRWEDEPIEVELIIKEVK